MKLNNYIKKLQEIQTYYGDLELIYAKDDEGNGYNEVGYFPEMVYYNKVDKELIPKACIEEYVEEDYTIVCCVN